MAGLLNWVNKAWSGLDFWDKEENKRQRQQFAAQDQAQQQQQVRRAEQQRRDALGSDPSYAQQQVDRGLDQGRSWEDIARSTNVALDDIRNYSLATRPNYGIKPPEKPKQGFFNKFRDVIDANTEADQYRRRMGNYLKGEDKPIVLENPGNIISNTVGSIPRMANTLANQAVEVGYTAQQHFATREQSKAVDEYRNALKTGNQQAINNARVRLNNASNRVKNINNMVEATKSNYGNGGGLFNAGTLYNAEDSRRGDIKTGLRKIVAGTGEGMLDVASLGLTGLTGKQFVKQGFKQGLKEAVPIMTKNALVNAGQNALSTTRLGGDVDDIIKSAVLGGTLGTAMDLGLAGIGAGFYKGAPKVAQVVDQAFDAPVKTDKEWQILNRRVYEAMENADNSTGALKKNYQQEARELLRLRNERAKAITQGGYAKLPGRGDTPQVGKPDPQVAKNISPIDKAQQDIIKAPVPTPKRPTTDDIKVNFSKEMAESTDPYDILIRQGLENRPANLKIIENSKNLTDAEKLRLAGGDVSQANLNKPVPKKSGVSQVASSKGVLLPTEEIAQASKLAKKQTSGTLTDNPALVTSQNVSQVAGQDMSSVKDILAKGIKVKGSMSDADYLKRYGKERAGQKIKVKPFTPEDYALGSWKDKSALGLGRETLERNIDRVAGADAHKVKKFLVEASRQNETNRANFLNTKRTEARQLIDSLNIKKGSKESALVQKYGEKIINKQQLIKEVGVERAKDIIKATGYFRKQYDDLLDLWNTQRRKYGYDAVPKRKDYFRHFQEINDTISALGMIGNARDLPTSISGKTDIFRPNKPFSNAELRRYTNETKFDAVGGFDNYLDSVSRQIFHTDTVQRGRAIENMIRKQADTNPDIKLPNFVANVGEWTNLVSGKKSRIDRASEALLGRKVYEFANTVRKQTGANMVGANLSSAMSNFIPFTQSLATTSKPSAIRGMLDTFYSPLKGKLSEIDGVQSSFLTRRFAKESIQETGMRKAASIASSPFKLVDEFTSRSIVAGKYYENLAKKMSPKEAMKAADDYASRVITDRSIGQTPNIFNSQTTGFITQFQTEVNNQVSFLLRDIPQMKGKNPAKVAGALTQFAIFSYLFNSGYEQVTGRRPQIDPINAGLQLFGVGEDNKDKDIKDRAKGAWEDIATGLPFTSLFGERGRLPIGSAAPDLGSITKGVSQLSEDRNAGLRNIYKGISGPLFYLAPPFGGGQLKKTLENANTFSKGYSETPSGQVRFTPDRNVGNFIKGSLFGQYATDEGRQYIKKGIKPYGEKDSELFKQTGEKTILENAEANRQARKQKEALSKSKGTQGQPAGDIIALKNGKFTTKINGEYKDFDTQEEAQKSRTVADFNNSDQKVKQIGDDYYIKDKSSKGYRVENKYEYEYNKNAGSRKLAMDRAYNSNDLESYVNSAKAEYDALEKTKQQYDPDVDQSKIDNITSKQESLQRKVETYLERGYIKKGGGGRGRGRGRGGSSKTANTQSVSKLSSVIRASASIRPPSRTSAPSIRVNTPQVRNTALKRYTVKKPTIKKA